MTDWIPGRVIAGYGVASGRQTGCPYPGGSIRQQIPYFMQHGVDLSPYFSGTLNVDLAPIARVPDAAHIVFDGELAWFDGIVERFVLASIELRVRGISYQGLWYWPDPATKPDHVQKATVVELLLPWIEGLATGDRVEVRV